MFIDCQYSANETCSYTCISPFRRNTQILDATCGADGGWNQNTQNLCTSKRRLRFRD
ncbi:hypothetical protein ACJMK2_039022, partial [Sinanodonta woodiana]